MDASSFTLTNAKGLEVEFSVEYYAYLLRAQNVADQNPVTVSNMLLKFGFIFLVGYGDKGQVRDFSQYEKGINNADPGYGLTPKGESALEFFKSTFPPSEVAKARKRQLR